MKMKKVWEIRKLGDVCEFRRGLTYSKNDEVENSKNAVLRSNNIDLITNQYDDRHFF
ncbi:MAG: restriction endonuclease subunit S [Treponema sp.]|nr:restriction endonuclease subunit S [Treponema sp.]